MVNTVLKVMREVLYFLMVMVVLVGCDSKESSEQLAYLNKKSDISNIVTVPENFYSLNVTLSRSQENKSAKIEDLITKLVRSKQFNGSVLVSENGNIIYHNSLGFSDWKKKVPLTDSSSFHLASVSKQFTAMGILMLSEQKKLSLDDDIRIYLPELPYTDIKIRNLLNHTSGVPNILNYLPNFYCYWDSCEIARNNDLVYIYKNFQPSIQFKPGNRFSYNNSNYVLLAEIIERVSGQSYESFIENRIFKVLGMHNSHVYNIHDEGKIRNRVRIYGPYRGGHSADENDLRNGMVGEKGIYASAVDLFKWDRALAKNILVADTTLQKAFDYSFLNNGRRINYGLGWRKVKNEPDIVYHFGHWRGANTCIIRFIKDNNCIIILNNTSSRRVKYLAQQIISILYEDKGFAPEF